MSQLSALLKFNKKRETEDEDKGNGGTVLVLGSSSRPTAVCQPQDEKEPVKYKRTS